MFIYYFLLFLHFKNELDECSAWLEPIFCLVGGVIAFISDLVVVRSACEAGVGVIAVEKAD